MNYTKEKIVKNKKTEFTNSVSHLSNKKNGDKCLDASEGIALYLKQNFIVSGQKEVLWQVHKILEDWYVERIAGAREVLEGCEENLKTFNS